MGVSKPTHTSEIEHTAIKTSGFNKIYKNYVKHYLALLTVITLLGNSKLISNSY